MSGEGMPGSKTAGNGGLGLDVAEGTVAFLGPRSGTARNGGFFACGGFLGVGLIKEGVLEGGAFYDETGAVEMGDEGNTGGD